MSRFNDRKQAGEILARKLLPLAHKKPVVLALPRGGLPVAAEIARELGAPLDILAVKKIGAPQNPEFAIGAVSEDGQPHFDEAVIEKLGLDRNAIMETAMIKTREAAGQAEMFRREFPLQPVGGRHVIVVDDGLATGSTMEAAVRVLRQRRVASLTIAVPVASKMAVKKLEPLVDKVVVLNVPDDFYAVGAWYRSFSQVTDSEAMEALRHGQLAPVPPEEAEVEIPIDETAALKGDLAMPEAARGIVIFAHGSGSSRLSPRNRQVAEALNKVGFATLLFDLLTVAESETRQNVFDIRLLAQRLLAATAWVRERYANLPLAYFGASTGGGAALDAAALNPEGLFAVISRGGRVDLASHPEKVEVPTLLIVGGIDEPVLSLNQKTLKALPHGRLAVVEGAGHLFVEPGALEEVIEYAIDWLLESLAPLQLEVAEPKEAITREIERLARPLSSDELISQFADSIASAKVIMLGEASHGTHEFYELRRRISEHLMRHHGFDFIAVEGDWPDCFALNRYIETGEGGRAKDVMAKIHRWPQWMWANTEVVPLIEWMRHWKKAGFYGLDVYSLFESIDVIREYADKLEPHLAAQLMQRYACFEPWERDEIAYAKSLLRLPEGCREAVVSSMRELLMLRLSDARISRTELFDMQQNARVIANAESYYRAMIGGGPDSWNVRDEHMLETLQVLLRRVGPKAIVWAHNTHIGDFHATDMAEGGYINLGGLAREAFGKENVCLVGFGTYQGEVLAGRAWGAPEEAMPVAPARAGDSYEYYFHQAANDLGYKQFSLKFDKASKKILSRRLGQRAIGVVYQPYYEGTGRNYVPTVLSDRYDAFVFVDRTRALSSLHAPVEHGLLPETWPMGQ